MSLRILKTGLLDTIQDKGRTGFQHLGINPTGVMDKYAAALANILVENSPDEAVIEFHFPAAVILFEKPAIIALAGADFNASINGEPIPICQPILINKSTVLQFHSVKNKSRCYMAIRGGMKLNKWLNSYSTNVKAEAGGLNGNKLIKDDVIEFLDETVYSKIIGNSDFKIFPWKATESSDQSSSQELLVIPGSEWDWLNEISQQKFLESPFFITANSDRMGYHLAGVTLQTKEKTELVSSAVSFGTIQLLPDGQLIILMADHQTAGGYPRIGNIISAHQSILAQMKTAEQIRFKLTDHLTAESMIQKQYQLLLQLQIACKLRLENYICENN